MSISEQLASGLARGELHVCMASIAAPMHRLLAAIDDPKGGCD
jgi:hypothetical protein